MSTNYYLHDTRFTESVHIGKRYGAGEGKLGWITDASSELWNSTDELVELLLQAVDKSPGGWVSDEYGRCVTPETMAEEICRCEHAETSQETFC